MVADNNKVSSSSDSHIHDDIAFSILSKLPIKSLTRFTCAKKSWSFLFQNPNFMNMFRTNFFLSKHDDDENDDSETRLLLKERAWGLPLLESLCILSGERFENRVSLDWPPPFQVNDDNVNVPLSRMIFILGSASVNGVLCLYDGLTTVLWNPATAEFKIIPPSFQPYEKIEFNSRPHGFGYDCVTNDFKVIREVQYPLGFEDGDWVYLPDKDDPFWEIGVHELDKNDDFWEEKKLVVKLYDPFWEIYSLKSNSWRKLDGVDMPDSYLFAVTLMNINGFCHWLTEGPDMVSFDFTKETFIATTLPSNPDMNEWMKKELVELNGSLSYITNYDDAPYFDIWILGELGVKESWIKFFVVGPLSCSLISTMSVGNKNRIFFREEEDFNLGWFDLSTQKSEKIEAEELFCSHIAIYKENLLPLEELSNL